MLWNLNRSSCLCKMNLRTSHSAVLFPNKILFISFGLVLAGCEHIMKCFGGIKGWGFAICASVHK